MTTTMAMDTLSVLLRARAVISSPEKWCIERLHDRGRHCAIGAIEVAMEGAWLEREHWSDAEIFPAILALDLSIPADQRFVPYTYTSPCVGTTTPNRALSRVASYNNRSNHKTVLAWFDRAIENTKTVNALAEVSAIAEQPIAVEPVE